MEDYVKKAQEAAAMRKAQEAAKDEAHRKEIERIQRLIDETKQLVTEGLKQWDGVLDIKFKEEISPYCGYYKLLLNDRVIVNVEVKWGSEVREYSDDCKVDHEGPKVSVSLPQTNESVWCSVQKRNVWKSKNGERVGNDPQDAAKCGLEFVADYISRVFM